MRPDIRSLLHGIFNLILPFFAYDLAGLLVFSLTAGNYTPWASFWPMAVLIHLPFLSDVIGVVVGAVRYKRSKRVCAMLGTIFSIGGAVLVLHAALPVGLYPVWYAGLIFSIRRARYAA